VLAAIREGHRVSHRLLTLAHRPNGLPHNRYAYATPRRLGGAVVRNRARRRLREIMRALPLRPGLDIVVMARPECAGASFADLRGAVESCARRGRLLLEAGGAPPTQSR
jgi:ribonuclease P protein component